MADNFHSQLVGWLKIALPLAALALLSTLFLFSRGPTTTSTIPYADIEEAARSQRVTKPYYAGVTPSGTSISITASVARPDPESPEIVTARDLRAEVLRDDGLRVELNAMEGTLDSAGQVAHLTGLARVESSDGYQVETRGLDADLETGRIASHGEVAARAPFGELSAGKLVVEPASGDTAQQLHFTEGVKLVYRPTN